MSPSQPIFVVTKNWSTKPVLRDDDTPLDRIRFLSRSDTRVDIATTILESGEITQRELRDRLDVSRRTVSRSLRALQDREWIESDGNTYRLTTRGRHIVAEFTDLMETVRRTEELAAFLRWFPADVDAPDFLDVTDAVVTASSDADPYAPARTQTEILYDADRLRVLLPAIDLESTKTLTEEVTDRGLEIESVVSPGVAETMASREFAPQLREQLETGRASILVTDEALPFYLGLADDGRVQIGLADEEGIPRALLETTDERVRTWAEDVYSEYRDAATPKSLEDI